MNLAAANRSSATLVASGMTAPQQLVLDEAHGAAYTVEYATNGNLYRINLATGAKTSIAKFNSPVGLALSADLQIAYVSVQGGASGSISRVRLSDWTSQTIVTGLTAPFFLTWADAAQSTLLVAERDPANRITTINVSSFCAQRSCERRGDAAFERCHDQFKPNAYLLRQRNSKLRFP